MSATDDEISALIEGLEGCLGGERCWVLDVEVGCVVGSIDDGVKV